MKQQRSTLEKRNALEEGQKRGCCRSTGSGIVALRRSWREIFPWKTGDRQKGKKRRPVETDAANGNPLTTRIPTAAWKAQNAFHSSHKARRDSLIQHMKNSLNSVSTCLKVVDTAEEKVAILRRHLLNHVPVSDLCEELGLQQRCSTAGRKSSSRTALPRSRARAAQTSKPSNNGSSSWKRRSRPRTRCWPS